ncbi:long-chain-fatty-acid--CoA ligase [Gottfriedia solisilvae]|uniref:Long-chain-fatty-acid--CoA ligase n=1 Tax=Gottfriedia solisilvae TaxID=1516104 RepID=A0A8J3AI59_9BACI|nr:long-chain-fatty-acid--CoA ligase [Gottfriedia solisilvae]GGI14833.1 long-chain-fatty-acid--CoA ligase [Gottfriedia solisilvae]
MTWNLITSLKKSVEKYPNRNVISFAGKDITYSELNKQVDCVAFNLAANGINKGDKVALILGNCPEFVISYYGILRAGAVVIPINPIYTKDEISYILSNSEAKAVIANFELEAIIDSLKMECKQIEILYYVGSNKAEFNWEQLIEFRLKDYEYPLITEEDLAVILYTSGTTGKPKGAMLSHRNMASNAESIVKLVEFQKEDRILAVLPMFHIFCLSVCINAPIMSGANIVIAQKFIPNEIIHTIFNEKVSLFVGVPTMYSFLFQLKDYTAEHFKTIRACLSGGAPLPDELIQRFEEKYQVTILEGFGCTETAPATAFNPINGKRKRGSVGINIPNVYNMIVDPNGDELPRGEVGELIVKGPNVMLGYLGMPEATSFAIKNGWFHTGDLAKMDEDGYIFIVDRMKDLIIVGGYNVYPREVEEVLYQHPAVVEAAVIGITDPVFGEQVKAFVVCNDESVSAAELIQFCSVKLAKYKAPRAIEIISELPKNSTGKILRRAIRESVEMHAKSN